ncbi:hypothetical protein [Bordetella tumulicola]|uniref:hypothetical protein n=1 Tax=Bordetella tumulicola TaxID=1649133 RepID=UPI0039EE4396
MKYTLCSLLLIWAIGLVLVSHDAHAAKSRANAQAVPVVAYVEPELSCPPGFPRDKPFTNAFPDLAADERDLSFADSAGQGEFPGYRDGAGRGFTCFISQATDAGTWARSRDYWLDTSRLVPSYPVMGGPLFLSTGWQWIDFD